MRVPGPAKSKPSSHIEECNEPSAPEFKTSFKTRVLYSRTSLGAATPAEAIAGIVAFPIVDVKHLPVRW